MLFERVDQGYDKTGLTMDMEIKMNKRMSKAMSEIRKSINSGHCFYCGKTVSSFCNSHTIPRYCLEIIGCDGKVTGPNSIFGLPDMGISIGKETPGIRESGTFFLICKECDNTRFQEYENPDNYQEGLLPTQKMLAQIAMKNYLKFIYKRKLEVALIEYTVKNIVPTNPHHIRMLIGAKERHDTFEMDLNEYTSDYNRAKRIAMSDNKTGFYIFYYCLLDYVTPIAIQAPITVSIDMEGQIVNDVFNKDTHYKVSDLHLCVFPQKTKTAVLLFVNDGDKRYSRFRRQFQKLDDETKLGVINYLIFLYSEDYFMAKEVSEMIDIKKLNETANITPIIWNNTRITNTRVLAEKFKISNWQCIPNLLSEEYQITR